MNFSPGKVNLIIHADDGGISRSVNKAIIESLKHGIVTSTSLMPPTPYFHEIASYFKQNPQYDVGIHLTLTCEFQKSPWKPVSGIEKIPSIVNSTGNLLTKNEFSVHATAKDVETEIRSQIEYFLSFGVHPTHMDTHQGTVFENIQFLEIYIKLALEYNMTPMLMRINEQTLELINKRKLPLDRKKVENLIQPDIPLLDFLYTSNQYDLNIDEKEQEYRHVIKNCPAGISQIIIHPAFDDDEPGQKNKNYRLRYFDYSIFTDPKIKQFIDEQGISLIRWKDLK